MVPYSQSRRWILLSALSALALQPIKIGADSPKQTARAFTSPVQLTAEQDHQRIMDLLHITSLRRGADGDPKSPNSANYDESKATPYTRLPDPLVF